MVSLHYCYLALNDKTTWSTAETRIATRISPRHRGAPSDIMPAQSAPIDIRSPNQRLDSNSPRNRPSNLTSALQAANGASHIPDSDIQATNAAAAEAPSVRKDSLAVPGSTSQGGTHPISFGSKPRRESGTGSFMAGMSWTGMSIGSLMHDDIMMTGTSPSVGSPSFHSSSYLPRMETNYWNNLKCCGAVFSDLHKLTDHVEAEHKPSHTNPFALGGLPRRKSSSTNPADWGGNYLRGFQPWSENRLNGLPSSRFGSGFEGGRKPSTVGMQDMDTIGEMEMDDEPTVGGQGYGQYQQMDGYSTGSTPQADNNGLPNGGSNGQSSQSSSQGEQQMQNNYSNAMFSNMTHQLNTKNQQQPTQLNFNQPLAFGQTNGISQVNGGFQTQQNPNAIPFNTQMFNQMSSSFGKMEFGHDNDMRDLCINEPAKNLYTDEGNFNTSQFPQFNFNNGTLNGLPQNGGGDITNNNDENAKKLQAQRLAAGVGKQPTEEERPFKCPVIGCEKAYKNANGLRYHEKHGHSSQKLKDNGNGTFSIVDPITSIPYPGTVGMEKEKPYRCEVCGKRYKNLNGLKYHRNHSPPCNPDFQTNQMPNLTDGEAVY